MVDAGSRSTPLPAGDADYLSAWRERSLDATPGSAANIAVLGDVHGSRAALTAVLSDAYRRGADEVWCLGDVVGRGPFARECVEMLGALGSLVVTLWLLGNHECAWLRLPCCPLERLRAAEQQVLTRHHATQLQTLRQLHGTHNPGWQSWDWPVEAVREAVPGGACVYAVHGGADRPGESSAMRYTRDPADIVALRHQALRLAQSRGTSDPRILLAGHTHTPHLAHWPDGTATESLPLIDNIPWETPVLLGPGMTYLNPGSAGGWARDGGGVFGTYVLLHITQRGESTATFVRVAVDLSMERQAMVEQEYPSELWNALHMHTGDAHHA